MTEKHLIDSLFTAEVSFLREKETNDWEILELGAEQERMGT